MTWLYDPPAWLSLIGVGLIVASVVGALFSGQRLLLAVAGIAAVLTAVPLLVDQAVETDQEQVKRLVYEMARCVRRNDVGALLQYVDPQAEACRARLETEMPRYDFSQCSVAGFKGMYFGNPDPLSVRVRLIAFVNVDAGDWYQGPVYRGVGLTFRKHDDGRFLLTHFSHFPAQQKYLPDSAMQNAYGRY